MRALIIKTPVAPSAQISCYISETVQDGRLIGTFKRSIEWCYFEWPWLTHNYPQTFWPLGQCTPTDGHRVYVYRVLVLIAQDFFLLECGQTDKQTDASKRNTHAKWLNAHWNDIRYAALRVSKKQRISITEIQSTPLNHNRKITKTESKN